MEGLVDLGYPAMHWMGVELAIFQLLVQYPNCYTTEPPVVVVVVVAVTVVAAAALVMVAAIHHSVSVMCILYPWSCGDRGGGGGAGDGGCNPPFSVCDVYTVSLELVHVYWTLLSLITLWYWARFLLVTGYFCPGN